MMTIKLLITYICFYFVLTSSVFSQNNDQPNIIYLMLDEWGYFESSHMGNPYLLTPNIDTFAKEGMRFTNAMAGAPEYPQGRSL